MSEGDSFKEEAARLGPTYQRNLEQLRRLGFIRRRRLRGDYKITAEGAAYLRDVVQRDDEVRAQLSRNSEKWESGEMTEVQRKMAQIELIFVGLSRDMGREVETNVESSDPAAWLEAPGLESGHCGTRTGSRSTARCAVSPRSGPSPTPKTTGGFLTQRSKSSPLPWRSPTIGYITNQLDFQHVSEAFEARGTADDKEVIVVWSKSNLQPAFAPPPGACPA